MEPPIQHHSLHACETPCVNWSLPQSALTHIATYTSTKISPHAPTFLFATTESGSHSKLPMMVPIKSSIELRNTSHWTVMGAGTLCHLTDSSQPIWTPYLKSQSSVLSLSQPHQLQQLSLLGALALADMSTSLNVSWASFASSLGGSDVATPDLTPRAQGSEHSRTL